MTNVTEPARQGGHLSESLPPSDGVVVFSFVLWTITIVVGVLGNGLMGAAIGYTASLRTAMNTYLLSIGLIDFLTCALLLPLRVYVEKKTLTGEAVASPLMGAELFIRTFTDISRLLLMQSLSIERYQAIARPFLVSKIQARRRAVVVSLVIWVISAVISALSVRYFCDTVLLVHYMCRTPGNANRQGDLEVFIEIPLTFLSVLAITVSYSLIVIVLRQQTNKLNQHSIPKYKANQIQPVFEDVGKTSYLSAEDKRISLSPKHRGVFESKPVVEASTNDANMNNGPLVTSNDNSFSKKGIQSVSRIHKDMDNLEQGCSYIKLYNKSLEDLHCERTGSTSVDTSVSISGDSSSLVAAKVNDGTSFKLETVLLDTKTIQPSIIHEPFDDLAKLKMMSEATVSVKSEPSAPKCVGIIPEDVSQGDECVSSDPQRVTYLPQQPQEASGISRNIRNDSQASSLRLAHGHPQNASTSPTTNLFKGTQDCVLSRNGSSSEMMAPSVYKITNHRRASFHNLTSSSNQTKDFLSIISAKNGAHPLAQPTRHGHGAAAATAAADPLKHSKLKGSVLQRSNSDVGCVSPTYASISNTSSCRYPIERSRECKYLSRLEDMFQQIDFSVSQKQRDRRVPEIETIPHARLSRDEGHRQFSVESLIQNDSVDKGEIFLKIAPSVTQNGECDDSPNKNVFYVSFDKNTECINNVSSQRVQNNSIANKSMPASPIAAIGISLTKDIFGIKNRDSRETPNLMQGMDHKSDGVLSSPKNTNNAGKMVEVVEMDGTVRVEMLKAVTNAGQIEGAVCLMNPKNREQGRRRVELKAALKVGLLFCSFVCLWMPLPIFVLVLRETSGWSDIVKIDMLCVFSALATSTAAVDPIIYGLLNNQIRSAAILAMKKLRRKTLERFRHDI